LGLSLQGNFLSIFSLHVVAFPLFELKDTDSISYCKQSYYDDDLSSSMLFALHNLSVVMPSTLPLDSIAFLNEVN
jgi:hypothetical protein